MQVQKTVEISGLDLLKHFGYITKIKQYKPGPLALKVREIEKKENGGVHPMFSRSAEIAMQLNDREFHDLYMENMTTYPQLFEGKGVSCQGCHEKIILPIDLRRDCGVNYHGVCFTSSFYNSLKKGTLSRPSLLEHHLRVARLCTPRNHPDASPLNEMTLEDLNITNREKLERFYWNNETPVD